jgi:hypothetical protein
MVTFSFFCLFTNNGSYGFLFYTAPTLLLCFFWTHFWWCGVVGVASLMEEGKRIEENDKERVVWSNMGGFYFFFNKEGKK